MYTYLSYNKYNSFSSIIDTGCYTLNIDQHRLYNELRKYYATNKLVYLELKSQQLIEPVGKIIHLNGLEATISIFPNRYSSYVSEMLYKAIPVQLSVRGLGEVNQGCSRINKFKISRVAISNYGYWF